MSAFEIDDTELSMALASIMIDDFVQIRVYNSNSKMQIANKNDIVLLLPFYETTESVRRILLTSDDVSLGLCDNHLSILDIRKHEKEGSLVIVDSKKAYFGSKTVDIKVFVG